MSGHIVDLYWSLLLNVAPFCKHAKRGRGGVWGPFLKKVTFFIKNALSEQYRMLR